MKKTLIIFSLITAITGCKVIEEVSAPDGESVNMTFNAAIGEDNTKTALDRTSVLWSANDAIKIYANGTGYDFTLASGAGTTSATFNGTAAPAETYYAIYPASAANGITTKARLSFTVPATQNYESGTFAQGANIMVAYGSNKDLLRFKNLCGVLKLTVKGNETISSVSITSNTEGECLNGTGAVSMKYGTFDPSTSVTDGTGVVTLNCGEGVQLTQDGIPFYIVLPEETLAGGFKVCLCDKDGGQMEVSAPASESNKILRNSIKSMPTLTYKSTDSGLTKITVAGIYDLTSPSNPPALARYSLDSFRQCNTTSGSNSLEMQLIDWKGLQLVTVKASANSLVEGATCAMTVHTRSFSGLTDGTYSATLEKVTDTLLYFRDSANNIGYVMPK